MPEKFVLDSPILEAAARHISKTNYPNKIEGRNCLQEGYIIAAYDGFFAVSMTDGKLSVTDGGDPESSTAGYFYFNGEIKKAQKQTGLTPKAGWLCLKADRVGRHGTFEIIDEIPSKPEKTGSYDYHPIAQIKKNGETFSVRQVSKWEIPQMWLFEDCESEKDGE